MGIFSSKTSVPLSQWLFFGIKKLNESRFATIQQYDEKNELDHEIKNHIDSTISSTKTIFCILNVLKLGLEGKLKVDVDTTGRTSPQVLHYYFTQQGVSESDSIKKTEELVDKGLEYFQYIQNNMDKLSDFSFHCSKKFADDIYPPKVNINDLSSTVNEGYKNVIIMKYAKFVFDAIETSLSNSLKNLEVVPD